MMKMRNAFPRSRSAIVRPVWPAGRVSPHSALRRLADGLLLAVFCLSLVVTPLMTATAWAQDNTTAPVIDFPADEFTAESTEENTDSTLIDNQANAANAPDAAALVNAKITITTLDDEWSTDTNTMAKTKCSLREALQATVQGNPQGNQGCGKYPDDTEKYTFVMPGGVYVLKLGDQLPNVTRQITIDGQDSVTIDGGDLASGRSEGIFIVGSTGYLILKNLILTHGKRPFGGAIWMKAGKVDVDHVTFARNVAENGPTIGEGGAIRVDTGELTVSNSIFKENIARDRGGAISTGGTGAIIRDTKFLKNRAEGGGGAIISHAGGAWSLNVQDSTFKENEVFVVSPALPYDPTYDSNGGGAIENHGQMSIERTVFDLNKTRRAKGGGAILNAGGADATLTDVAMTYNRAETDQDVEHTFGAVIINEGVMKLIRASIHHNITHLGGVILNRTGATLLLANTTLSENQSLTYDSAAIANGTPIMGSGGDVYLYHATIVRNVDQNDDPVAITTNGNATLYMSNSIMDTTCSGSIYTFGNNIFIGLCPRIPANNDVNVNSDLSVPDRAAIKLGDFDYHGGPQLANGFYTVKLESDSPAIDAANDIGCNDPLIARRDQTGAKRGAAANGCDIGAMEGAPAPAKLESTPAINSNVLFPAVFVLAGGTTSKTTVDLTNAGGGVINYTATIDESWDNTFILESPASGVLFKNQHALLELSCTPPQKLGPYYGSLLVKSDAPGAEEVRYKLICAAASFQDPAAAPYQKPGPLSSGNAAPGEQTMVSANIANLGPKPMTTAASWKNLGNGVMEFVASKGGVVVAASAMSPAGQPIILNTNEVLNIDITCTPNGPGLFVDTLQITTNDPIFPLLEYGISCEGATPPAPEKLTRMALSQVGIPGKHMAGIALSPDELQIAVGNADNGDVSIYSRNPNGGSLSLQGPLSKAGMSGVHDVKYSHDGKNIYYTSRTGNAVVTATRDANGAPTVTGSISKGLFYVCGIDAGNQPVLCQIEAMGGAYGLDVSPDDQNVYAVGFDDHTLAVLRRNPTTGALSYVESFPRMLGGKNVLGGATRVLVSHDGQTVYVTAYLDNSLAVFARGVDGRLQFRSAYQDGAPGLDNLAGLADLAQSPDGKFLYVTSRSDNAILVFKRAAGDGSLKLVQQIKNVPGAYGIAVSHDTPGVRVLVALYDGDELRVYSRNQETGKLKFVESQTNTNNQLSLDGPGRVISSSNEQDVYTTLYDGRGTLHLRSLKHLPLAQNLSPASVQAGANDVQLTVNGAQFYPDSQVLWNGAALATTFVTDKQLRAVVAAAQVSGVGSANVQVRNLALGGGDSAPLPFAIIAPGELAQPSVESITPPAITSGVEPLNVVVRGANFTPQSSARLNGRGVATTYINRSMLLVQLAPSDLDEPGPMAITVVNTTPTVQAALVEPASEEQIEPQPESLVNAAQVEQPEATKLSKAVKFSAAAPGQPALPAITLLSPASVAAGAEGFTLAVTGFNFSEQGDTLSVLMWDGEARPTTVLNAHALVANLTAADLAKTGKVQIKIYTPGVGESAPATFVVRAPGSNPTPLLTNSFVSRTSGQWQATLSGSEFVAGAKVTLNGSDRAAVFVNAYQINVILSDADLTAGGVLRVVNPAPGGGASNVQPLAPRKNQTINFAPLGSRPLNAPSFVLNATSTSQLPVSFGSATPQICKVQGKTVTLVAVGVCKIVAAQPGSVLYNPAPSVQRSFAVAQPLITYLPMVVK